MEAPRAHKEVDKHPRHHPCPSQHLAEEACRRWEESFYDVPLARNSPAALAALAALVALVALAAHHTLRAAVRGGRVHFASLRVDRPSLRLELEEEALREKAESPTLATAPPSPCLDPRHAEEGCPQALLQEAAWPRRAEAAR